MRKFNEYLKWGLLVNVIWLVSSRFNLLPDFIEGFCVGLGIVLLLNGIYIESHNLKKLKKYKRNFLNKIK